MSDAVRFTTTREGAFADQPGMVRFSRVVATLRANGGSATADRLEADRAVAARCGKHGDLADPVVGIMGDRVAFACPHCSGGVVLAQWEREAPGS